MKSGLAISNLVMSLVALAGSSLPVLPGQHSPTSLSAVDEAATMEDRLGNQAALQARFIDENGAEVSFGELFNGERPVILNPGYFGCPGLCGAVLNYFLGTLKDSGMMPGQDFDLVTLSIDPDEGPEMARTKKAAYLEDFGHPEVADHWRFLTGTEEQIQLLTESVGWRFRYVTGNGQYDHPPVVVFLSSRGYVTRYLNALTMSATTLRRAVVEASEGRVGSFLERVLLSCLTFDPTTGAYTVTAMTVMRIGGVVTVLALGFMIYTLRRRERTRVTLATT